MWPALFCGAGWWPPWWGAEQGAAEEVVHSRQQGGEVATLYSWLLQEGCPVIRHGVMEWPFIIIIIIIIIVTLRVW